jgi:hypothetical protein
MATPSVLFKVFLVFARAALNVSLSAARLIDLLRAFNLTTAAQSNETTAA